MCYSVHGVILVAEEGRCQISKPVSMRATAETLYSAPRQRQPFFGPAAGRRFIRTYVNTRDAMLRSTR